MVDTKPPIPCPKALASSPCGDDCPVCHGRGTVREWTLVLEVDWVSPGILWHLEQLEVLPVGLTIDRESEEHGYPVIVARVQRHKLSEAMNVACEFLADAKGGSPLVRRAW